MSKILYVEDHPAQRDIMAQMLKLGGFEVAVAADGLEGVNKAQSLQPDIILMDLRMPRMDGFEAIKIIRSEDITSNIPILAVSAWASTKHKIGALAAGADEHFTKPVDLNKLMSTIHKVLNSSKDALKRQREIRQTKLIEEMERMEAEVESQKFESLGRAFAATKHDLVGLLSIILHDAEEMFSSPPTPDKIKRIWRSTRYAFLLLQNVSDLYKSGSLNLESANIPSLIEDALDLVEPEFRGRVKISRQYTPKLPGVRVDELRFQQVLINLFKNAIEAQADVLHIGIERTKGYLQITVTDNGKGFDYPEPERLFGLWETTKEGEGRGLGLYIVKTIIEQHDWKIELNSKPKKGASFVITIPPDSLTESINLNRKFTDKKFVASAKPGVLIVDDNADTLDLLRNALTSPDYSLDTVWSLKEALNQLKKKNYDVVITDLRLPDETNMHEGLAGIEILSIARTFNPPVQTIVITGYGSDTVAQEIMKSGAFDYVVKPVNFKRLRVSILEAIRTRQEMLMQELAPPKSAETPNESISIIGNSPVMEKVISEVYSATLSNDTIMISGEGGTGKSFIAESIHTLSPRRNTNLYIANCATLTASSLQNLINKAWHNTAIHSLDEGFGQIRNTVYLDSVEDLDSEAQKVLLVTLEAMKKQAKVHIWFISSLGKEEDSNLRSDLRRRLSDIHIHLPSLRERQEDIPLLVGHFLRKYSLEYGLQIRISDEALYFLQGYSFPDNIVELEQIVKSCVRKATEGIITTEHLPNTVKSADPCVPDLARVSSLKKQLRQYYNNLYSLEERRAKYGIDVPISLINEIETIKEEIERIEIEIEEKSKNASEGTFGG